MGTRHITAVYLDGSYKIAQYGQWDGYPEGQGKTILRFLKKWDRPVFEAHVRASRFHTDAELEAINKAIEGRHDWQQAYPALTRDTGAEILQLVQDTAPGIRLKNEIEFVQESLMCEWAYVLDLDKDVLEIYEGFNHTALTPEDRFYRADFKPYVASGGTEYHQVRLLLSYPLAALPTPAKMRDAANKIINQREKGKA